MRSRAKRHRVALGAFVDFRGLGLGHVAAVFQEKRHAFADDDRSGVGDGALDRDSRHRNEAAEFARERAPSEAAADDRQQLPHALQIRIAPVCRLDVQQQHHLNAGDRDHVAGRCKRAEHDADDRDMIDDRTGQRNL